MCGQDEVAYGAGQCRGVGRHGKAGKVMTDDRLVQNREKGERKYEWNGRYKITHNIGLAAFVRFIEAQQGRRHFVCCSLKHG